MASLIGLVVVFVGLVLLIFAFNFTAYLSVRSSKKRMERQNTTTSKPVSSISPSEIPASEIAAISMALHLYFNDTHDEESNIITIKRIERRYSPWNSKLYGMNNDFRKW
ncbi:MAG: OadG family protein [Prolixibacteraceae bacterium]|nr:OadG family protein [Prolixibacteraceae bacterium]